MREEADRMECPSDEAAAAPLNASVFIPLILGCAFTGVAVFMAYSFMRREKASEMRALSEQARVALRESLEAMKQRDYTSAEAAGNRAVRLAERVHTEGRTPDVELLATAYLFRGESRAGLPTTEKLKRAVEDYTKCVELNPSDEDRFLAYYGRGQVRFRLGRAEEAEADFTQALKINAYSVHVYGARAQARRRLGNGEGAKADERRVQELGGSMRPKEPSEPSDSPAPPAAGQGKALSPAADE